MKSVGIEPRQTFTGPPDGYASPSAAARLVDGWSTQHGQVTGEMAAPVILREEDEDEFSLSQIPVNSDFPSSLWNIPFVSRMIASSADRLGSSNERRRVLNEIDEFDLGGLSNPIGREVDLGQRRADLGYMPRSFKLLGFHNYSPS